MYRISLIALSLLLVLGSSAAFAKDVTITLNDQEQKVFFSLLDSALKNGGLTNLQAVTQIIKKFQDAAGPSKPVEPNKE